MKSVVKFSFLLVIAPLIGNAYENSVQGCMWSEHPLANSRLTHSLLTNVCFHRAYLKLTVVSLLSSICTANLTVFYEEPRDRT